MKPRTGAEMFRSLLAMDDALAQHGVPPLSSWWRAEAERFYLSGAPTWWALVGRGGSKSSTIEKFALNELLFQNWKVPPGKRHWAVLASENVPEASARLLALDSYLTLLGEQHEWAGSEIKLQRLALGLMVRAARIGALSGPRAFHTDGDELGKWRDGDKDPTKDVLGSMAAMAITHPHARHLRFSSATTKGTEHYEAVAKGDIPGVQMVSTAESWIANPDAITEAQTRAAEPDPDIWLREYANVPSDGVIENYFGTAVDLSIDPDPPKPIDRSRWYSIAIDPKFARGTSDRFGVAVVSSVYAGRDPVSNEMFGRMTIVHQTHAWPADRSPQMMAVRVRDEVMKPHNHDGKVWTDQFEGNSFQELAKQVGVRLEIIPWTPGEQEDSKSQRYRAVRLAMLQGEFRIPNDPALIREFRSVQRLITPQGHEKIEVPRSSAGHGDRVSAVVLAATQAMARAPQFPVSVWTAHDYNLESIAYAQGCNGWSYYHPIFNPSGESGGYRWSWEQLQNLIRRGEWKDDGPQRYGRLR